MHQIGFLKVLMLFNPTKTLRESSWYLFFLSTDRRFEIHAYLNINAQEDLLSQHTS